MSLWSIDIYARPRAGMNLPGFILVWPLRAILVDYLTVTFRLPVAAGIFWGSWHFVLRFLRWRTRLERTIILKLRSEVEPMRLFTNGSNALSERANKTLQASR